MRKQLQTEVLIIGCGIAGGVAALQLADAGLPVTVITRVPDPQESNTYHAQGGIIYKGVQDSPALLAEDIIRAGAGHCEPGSVTMLAERGPALIEEILLKRVGVDFDQNGAGLSLAREGGHSLPRIIHAADATGKAIATALLETLQRHPRVTILSSYTAVDLILSAQTGRCAGAYLLDQSTGQIVSCAAGATILATGGLGQVFWRTSNPAGARGDGVAMAHRAGARISDMEFVQFHPTTFYHPEARSFLISEAVRGAGARLVNSRGEPFMQNYDAEWKDLAPRDIVARSIHQEMRAQGVSHVYLDLRSYIPVEEIRSHFPTIYDYCWAYGVDITQDLVPVVPAAHYACGGVQVDSWGQSSLEGLYAIGEVSCTGLHGANRLASTSLLEGLVWGDQAATHIQSRRREQSAPDIREVPLYPYEALASPDLEQINQTGERVRRLMWEHVGLVRTAAGLEYALNELDRTEAEVESRYRHSAPADELIGLRNIVQVARLITSAALENPHSQGCHYRLPEEEGHALFRWRLQLAEPALAE